MVEQVVAWVGALTGLATAVQTWRDAIGSGHSPAIAREKAAEAGETAATEPPVREAAVRALEGQVIDGTLLQTLVDDIKRAQDRFINSLRDPRFNPAQIDQEEAIARASICAHLKRIKGFNNGQLGHDNLERMWQSNKCES
jgi:hypothetical protein